MNNNHNASIWNKNWLSGLFGTIAVLLFAFWFEQTNALTNGIDILGLKLTSSTFQTTLFALVASSTVVFCMELFKQARLGEPGFFEPHPEKNLNFYANCFVFYIQTIILLMAVQMFYRTAGEYGYSHKAAYYRPWFESLNLFINAYYYLGLPYIIFTRSLKYNPEADNLSYGHLVGKIFNLIVSRIPFFKDLKPTFSSTESQAFLSILLQMFFLPLIIVFFFTIFPQLIQAITYIKHGMPNSFTQTSFNHGAFNLDIARLAISFLFPAQLVILFTSYAMTSRWIQNNNRSVDDSIFSWLICLIVYPPFHHMLLTSWIEAKLGPQLEAPSHVLTQASNQTWITICIAFMIIFYLLHIISSIYLGKNYANLSCRNLVENGPFSIVRHPAYATKLLGITSIILPLMIINAVDAHWILVLSLLGGLILGWILFTVRALREERLLKLHCDYEAYCKKVPYRFIPRVV